MAHRAVRLRENGIVTQSHDADAHCYCVVEHRPAYNELHSHHVWPLGEGGPAKGEKLWLCPTMHVNVHELWEIYAKHAGAPPWNLTRQYSRYCRSVVDRGWRQAHPPQPGVRRSQ